jgi:hypothetical protein
VLQGSDAALLAGLEKKRMHIRLVTEGQEVDREWDVKRCPYPGCDYFQERRHNLEIHIKGHADLCENMNALGWFWGSIRTILQKNPYTMIRDAMGENPVF